LFCLTVETLEERYIVVEPSESLDTATSCFWNTREESYQTGANEFSEKKSCLPQKPPRSSIAIPPTLTKSLCIYWRASKTLSGVYKFEKLYMHIYIYGCTWSLIVARAHI